MTSSVRPLSLVMVLGLIATAAGAANDSDDDTAIDAAVVLPDYSVIGSSPTADALPGSAHILSRDDLTRQGDGDVHRALRSLPGVTVREEDGYGLFPNISLRGVDPGRSSKVTLMEDGVPIAPAPYAAPAAYFSPSVERMAGLEVIKGSSQVRFGPHTTGGVINYLSTPIPLSHEGYLRTAYGTNNEWRNHLWVGDTQSHSQGIFGYLVELNHRQTDGYREYTGPLSVLGPDAGKSGFQRIDPTIKLSWQPATQLRQRIDLTVGQSELDADETYLGLSTADLRANPRGRYIASQFDNIRTKQQRAFLRYRVEPSDALSLQATVYRTDFQRNWDKIRTVNGVGLGAALAGSNGGVDLATLRGEMAGTWGYRDNNRKYAAEGLDLQSTWQFATGSLNHALRVGVRWHNDQVLRFQRNTEYQVDDQGIVTGRTLNPVGSQDNRLQQVDAVAVYLEDTIAVGNWTFVPGVRFESLDFRVVDRRRDPVQISAASDEYVAGGMGVTYALSPRSRVFGGVYQGFSPPDPGTAVGGDSEDESSLSIEVGHRWNTGITRQEVVAYATAFDNLRVVDNAGASGSTDDPEAVGEVDVYGLEYLLATDFSAGRNWPVRVPVQFAATWTQAEIVNDSTSVDDAESIFSGGREGAELPYVPEYQFSLTVGLERGSWSLSTRGQYVDSTFATALNTADEVILGSADGGGTELRPDARGGRIDSSFLVDMTLSRALGDDVRVFVNALNVFDREYLSSRLPEGPRSGASRMVLVGLEASIF